MIVDDGYLFDGQKILLSVYCTVYSGDGLSTVLGWSPVTISNCRQGYAVMECLTTHFPAHGIVPYYLIVIWKLREAVGPLVNVVTLSESKPMP